MIWSPCCPRDSQESSPTLQLESINSSALSLLNGPNFTSIDNSYMHTWLLEKNKTWTIWTFVGKVMSLLFNILSRFIIAFLPSSKLLLISWLQSPSAVILEHKKIKLNCHCFHCFLIYLPWSDGTRCHDLFFWMLSFKPAFFTLLFHLHQETL